MCEARRMQLAYFLYLEHLRGEGMLDRYSDADLKKLTTSSIQVFNSVRTNLKKSQEYDKAREGSVMTNFVSKHYLSYTDFAEELGFEYVAGEENPETGERVSATVKHAVIIGGEASQIDQEKAIADTPVFPVRTPAEMGISIHGGNFDTVFAYSDEGMIKNPIYPYLSEIWQVDTDERVAVLKNDLLALFSKYGVSNVQEPALDYTLDTVFNLKPETSLARNIKNLSNSTSVESSIGAGPVSLNGEDVPCIRIDRQGLEDGIRGIFSQIDIAQYIIAGARVRGGGDEFMDEAKRLVTPVFESMVEDGISGLGEGGYDAVGFGTILRAMHKQQNEGMGGVSRSIGYLNLAGGFNEIYSIESQKRAVEFEIRAKAIEGVPITTIPIYKDKAVKRQSLEFYKEVVDKEDMSKRKRENISPDDITIIFDPASKFSAVRVDSFKEDVPLRVERNSALVSRTSFHDSVPKKYFTDMPIGADEADKRAGGVSAKVFRWYAAVSPYIVGATATLIEGSPEAVVSGLAQDGSLDTKEIKENRIQFTNQCGIFEIKSRLLAKTYAALSNHNFLSHLSNKTMLALEDKNIYMAATELVEKTIAPSLENMELLSDSELADLDMQKEAGTFKTLLIQMQKLMKEEGVSDFKKLFERSLFEARSLVKARPGIYNPKTFTGLMKNTTGKSTNFSVMSRERLTGKTEEFIVPDRDFIAPFINPVPGEGGGGYQGDFVGSNRVGLRVLQAAVDAYATTNFLYQARNLLSENFGHFINNFKSTTGAAGRRASALTEIINTRLQNRMGDEYVPMPAVELVSSFPKSSKSASDDFASIYKKYLDLNGDIDHAFFQTLRSERRELFREMVEIFDSFMGSGVPKIYQGEEYKYEEDGVVIDLSRSKYLYMEQFKSGKESVSVDEVVLSSLKDGFPRNFVFSSLLDVCPSDLRHLFAEKQEGRYLPYRIELCNASENEVFDALASKGAKKIVGNSIAANESLLVSSTRTAGTMINFLNALDEALKFKEANPDTADIEIIVNRPGLARNPDDANFSSITRRLDKNKIPDSIIITYVGRTMMEATLHNALSQGRNVVLVSNYESTSRGLDLSKLDTIVATGGLKKGRETIQFLHRQYHVDRQDARVYMHNGGEDGALSFPYGSLEKLSTMVLGDVSSSDTRAEAEEMARRVERGLFGDDKIEDQSRFDLKLMDMVSSLDEDVHISPTEADYINFHLAYRKQEVYTAFMGGRKMSEVPKEGNEIFKPSEKYGATVGANKGKNPNQEVGQEEDMENIPNQNLSSPAY